MKVVQLLLQEGAKINVENGTFGTPLRSALVGRRAPFSSEGQEKAYGAVVLLLLEKGADINSAGDLLEYAQRIVAGLDSGAETESKTDEASQKDED